LGINSNIIEPGFKRSKASGYQLSILIGMDSLVYSVYESDPAKMLVLQTVQFDNKEPEKGIPAEELEQVIDQEDLLALPYRLVKIGMVGLKAALVPARLYNDDERHTYLDELSANRTEGELVIDDLDVLKIKVVHQIGQQEATMLRARFPNCQFFNAATPFLAGAFYTLPSEANEIAFASFDNHTFQIAVFDRGNLLFHNSFPCTSAGDILYFVLLAFEQYGLDPMSVPLVLSGQVVEDSEIYKTLYRYILDITFLSDIPFVQFGPTAESIRQSFFFKLHSLLLCKAGNIS